MLRLGEEGAAVRELGEVVVASFAGAVQEEDERILFARLDFRGLQDSIE